MVGMGKSKLFMLPIRNCYGILQVGERMVSDDWRGRVGACHVAKCDAGTNLDSNGIEG
jgi:hypothetical protein